MGERPSAPAWRRIIPKPLRLYQQVAEQIARRIAEGIYPLGKRLPAERELAVEHAVSRPTIREAIIALEMEGLVEVRLGAGVFAVTRPQSNRAKLDLDVGAFELTEARFLFEGEVAGLAARVVTDEQLAEIDALLGQMELAVEAGDNEGAEQIDREFHLAIAQVTRNSVMIAMVDYFWEVRNRSPQCLRIFGKSRDKGTMPGVDEHRAVLEAMRKRDSAAARSAMRAHLTKVLDSLLEATETEELERVKAMLHERRRRVDKLAS
mgnify:CR=1 FL=1